MRKYTITCKCGQRMLVPRSAVGKRGMCPSCGDAVDIGPDFVERQSHRNASYLRPGATRWQGGGSVSSDEARQRFGQAVDLFYAGRYAEALAIFDLLARQFPANAEVESGRARCVAVLNRKALPGALGGATARLPSPQGGDLDAPTIKRVVLDIMIHGSNSEVRLQAAELACKLLGLVSNGTEGHNKAHEGPVHEGPVHEGEEAEGDEAEAPAASVRLSDAGWTDNSENEER